MIVNKVNKDIYRNYLVPGVISRIWHTSLFRYLLASLLALILDTAIFSASLRVFGFGLGLSATFGFVAGVILTYVFSITWVFKGRVLNKRPILEFLLFIGIGIIGLGVTQLVLWMGVIWLQFWPEMVKLAAAVATFICNYLLRRGMLFISQSHAPVIIMDGNEKEKVA